MRMCKNVTFLFTISFNLFMNSSSIYTINYRIIPCVGLNEKIDMLIFSASVADMWQNGGCLSVCPSACRSVRPSVYRSTWLPILSSSKDLYHNNIIYCLFSLPTQMYGRYSRDLQQFAGDEARRLRKLAKLRKQEDRLRSKVDTSQIAR